MFRLRRQQPRTEILFVGTPEGSEAEIMKRYDYEFELVPGAPFQRTRPSGRVRAMSSLAAGIGRSRTLLRSRRIEAVIGFGGYAALGGVLAARSLGLWCAILEPNAAVGQANRILRHVANRIYVSHAGCHGWLPAGRTQVVGTPVREEIRAVVPSSDRSLDLQRERSILVLAGAEPSPRMGIAVASLLRRLHEGGLKLRVVHQIGPVDSAPIERIYTEAGICSEIDDHLESVAPALPHTDFVIGRSGASTIAELCVSGIPSLLVPLPEAAEDHQTRNARFVAAAGAAIWTSEADWDEERLAAEIGSLLRDQTCWKSFSDSARRLMRPDAGSSLVTDLSLSLQRHAGEARPESMAL